MALSRHSDPTSFDEYKKLFNLPQLSPEVLAAARIREALVPHQVYRNLGDEARERHDRHVQLLCEYVLTKQAATWAEHTNITPTPTTSATRAASTVQNKVVSVIHTYAHEMDSTSQRTWEHASADKPTAPHVVER